MTMKMTPKKTFTPDYSPVVKMMAMQTRLMVETSQNMMKLAMLPWQGMPMPSMKAGFGSICAPGGVAKKAPSAKAAAEAVEKAAAVTEEVVETTAKAADQVVEASAEAAEEVAETTVETMEATVDTTTESVEDVAADAAETTAETVEAADDMAEEIVGVAPAFLSAPEGEADDLTTLMGVGPKLAVTLNEAGIYHFSQIAEWTEDNVAWVDANIAGVRGRAAKNGWVAQAADLTK
ncbi:hypothetical protein SSE37_03760 [Sagittula stellata E-37]|uniref:NADH dehydrogenase subunit E n=2 Tax=Sagittula stellata TaxID=52603 RepID=A3K1D2_SAGS3|nr:hypothetical protein SSE37_03760 [Sagittula stellata E-37]